MGHNQEFNFTLHSSSMERMAKLGCPFNFIFCIKHWNNPGHRIHYISGHPIKRRSLVSSPICVLSRNSTFSRFTKSQKLSISWIITWRWIWTDCYFSIYCWIKKTSYRRTIPKIDQLNNLSILIFKLRQRYTDRPDNPTHELRIHNQHNFNKFPF